MILKIQIPFSVFNLVDPVSDLSHIFCIAEGFQFFFNKIPSLVGIHLIAIIHEIFSQGKYGIRCTEAFYETGNGKFHKMFTGSAESVTCCTKGREHLLIQKFRDDLAQRPVIVDPELAFIKILLR